MNTNRPDPDWMILAEQELKTLHEELDRIDGQGQLNQKLIKRVTELQEALNSAKSLLSRDEPKCG